MKQAAGPAALATPDAARAADASARREHVREALRIHDEALAASAPAIWVGSEPTFTDAASLAPEWGGAALGGDKAERAEALVAAIARRMPGAMIVRTAGRQYPGEPSARFSIGLYARRQGDALWPADVASDPLLSARWPASEVGAQRACDPATEAPALRAALVQALENEGASTRALDVDGPLPMRLAFCADAETLFAFAPADLGRPSCHSAAIPDSGLRDPLAERGVSLLGLGEFRKGAVRAVRLELPTFLSVDAWLAFAELLAGATRAAGVVSLVLTGHPPPADRRVAFTTITPDPGVIEVNAAPCEGALAFYAQQRTLFEAAREVGLSPERYRYDGTMVDSGGGGHLTMGGPSYEETPFVRSPHLLPGLIRYTNHHPSLSYAFAVDSIGSSSQSPRADENVWEVAAELPLALHRLAQRPAVDAQALWAALGPLMSDHAGNTHRAAINVEKLGNPHLPGRGRLGVVELRSMSMPRSPEHAAARAALFRSIAMRLSRAPFEEPLVQWGAELHDRFALPTHLTRDLVSVLSDLRAHGLGLSPTLEALLLEDDARRVARVERGGLAITLRRALEFWPLVGDTASQEQSGARWVDASTQRLEVVLSGAPEALRGVSLRAAGVGAPLEDVDGARVAGVRYRAFEPRPGLHPGLPVMDPLELVVVPAEGDATRLRVHSWIPGGGTYAGFPQDSAEATRRVEERVVVDRVPRADLPAERALPAEARTTRTVDLRWL